MGRVGGPRRGGTPRDPPTRRRARRNGTSGRDFRPFPRDWPRRWRGGNGPDEEGGSLEHAWAAPGRGPLRAGQGGETRAGSGTGREAGFCATGSEVPDRVGDGVKGAPVGSAAGEGWTRALGFRVAAAASVKAKASLVAGQGLVHCV